METNKLFIRFSATRHFTEVDHSLKMTIRRAILKTLEYEVFPCDTEVSVTLCDNEYIKELNKKYRNKDKATDVLSFPLYDFDEEGDDPFEIEETVMLGDIVISVERAKEQAKEVGNGFHEEISFLTIHSTLHLLGYDHERSEEDEKAQITAQKDIVKIIKEEYRI